MKRINIVACALLCIVSIVVSQTEKGQKSATVKTTEKKEIKAEDKGVPKLMGGMLVAVDATQSLITIRVKSNNYNVAITPQTALVAKENKISFL